MTQWIRVLGLSVLPLIGVIGAVPAFAADPPKKAGAAQVGPSKASPPPVVKAAPTKAAPGSEVMLNPQPIPPGKAAGAPAKAAGRDKAIIFVGGKDTKAKTTPKAKTGSPAIPPGPPGKQNAG